MTDPVLPGSPNADSTAHSDSAEESASQALLLEISKALLSGTLATTRGAMQILQGLTGILLASYTTLLVGFGKEIGISKIPVLLAASPVVCYVLSLLSGFGQILLSRGASITLGNLPSGFEAYEAVVSAQRKQLILPLVFLFGGLIAVIAVTICLLRVR